MNQICRDIFQAIHEGKWLHISYRNRKEEETSYWIGIKELNPGSRTLKVEGLHLGLLTNMHLECIYIDKIQSAHIIEGTYFRVNKELVQDIYMNPEKYQTLFDNAANLRILNYLEDCNRMDVPAYRTDFSLVEYLDAQRFAKGVYTLDQEQFNVVVKNFSQKVKDQQQGKQNRRFQQLALNILSIHTPRGLYVLAWRRLDLDVVNRRLKPADEITVCKEFTIDGEKQSIRRYLEAADYELLNNFEENLEEIKDCITVACRGRNSVDDMPYIIGIGMDRLLDLHKEYSGILKAYNEDKCPVPLRAFFGDLLKRPYARTPYPLALVDKRINLDQILAIHNAMKYSVAYIQGPPGTGKTSTIINTISTAFFHDKTVLLSSYNNHPIDGVFEKLSSMTYHNGRVIPFPVVRLGNKDKIPAAIKHMRRLYEIAAPLQIFEKTLDKNRQGRKERAKKLSDLLKRYDEVLDLRDRVEALQQMEDYHSSNAMALWFQTNLRSQADRVREQIKNIGEIDERSALSLLDNNDEDFRKYLYYTSAKYLKKLDKPKYEDIRQILFLDDIEKAAEQLNEYLKKSERVKKFLEVFPIVITTCISAAKIGEPEAHFDMVIIDEASQCNTAITLVPVLRGRSLMLVGDPQQLNPVVLLDETVNSRLKQKYGIGEEYDYRKNSIYKTYLACDSVSDEVLLRSHYRCNEKIIDFNNRKYYQSMLQIKSRSREAEPLVYIDVPGSTTTAKNTAPDEVEEIVRYAAMNKDKSIGIITPFVNQKELIARRLREENMPQIACGTVHAFQGDEKDVILFSTAVTKQTYDGTYDWLKNNRELINVATSRAREKLVVFSDYKELTRLHRQETEDDLFELVEYVRSKGVSRVSGKKTMSRALGTKPYSTETETAFLENLNHAMGNIWLNQNKFTVKKEVAIAQVFRDNVAGLDLFYTGRFDFVVYEKQSDQELPVLAIELDGKEHIKDEAVRLRDQKKNTICQQHGLELVRVENSYARRYNHIKEILMTFFGKS